MAELGQRELQQHLLPDLYKAVEEKCVSSDQTLEPRPAAFTSLQVQGDSSC